MTKDDKKDLFLLILESWFDDKTGQINSDNCIGFYHYFLYCLEFASEFSPEYEPGFHSMLTVTIKLLSDFPTYEDSRLHTKEGLRFTMFNFDKSVNLEFFDSFFLKLRELFVMFKNEYFF